MTEEEWLACDDPERMLREVGPAASARKLRLFMCACCRRVWTLIQELYCRVSVEVTEKYLEGEATDTDFSAAADDVGWAWSLQRTDGSVLAEEAAMYPTVPDPVGGAISCVHCILDCCRYRDCEEKPPARDAEAAAQASLLRCIFGNPFRPVTLDPAPPATVLSVAQAAYEARELPSGHLDPARHAILADALEETGCTDAAILTHLRSPGPHVRGCFVLDLLLDKR